MVNLMGLVLLSDFSKHFTLLVSGSESLVVMVVEEDCDRSQAISAFTSIYLCERELRVLGPVAVQVDVPTQVECGGENHHAPVVHPLPVLPLPGRQVGQASFLTLEDHVDYILHNLLGQMTGMITNLNK